MNVNFTPTVALAAQLQGTVDAIVASGGLQVSVQLAALSAPMNANLTWAINPSPNTCAGPRTAISTAI
jgi:hypothetical protein